MNLSTNDLKNLKELMLNNLKVIISDFNEYLSRLMEIPKEISSIQIEFLEKSSFSFPYSFTVKFETIRNFFADIFPQQKYSYLFRELKRHELFDLEHNLLNPHLTPFGALVKVYIQKLIENDGNVDIKELLPFKFSDELFEKCWNALIPWITDYPIKVKVCYLIYNVNIEGENFDFDKKRRLKFIVPTKEEKMALIEEINIVPFYFEGQIKAINRAKAIADCTAWIEGEIELTNEQLEKTLIDLDTIHPSYFEEAFYLLGCSNIFIGFLTVNNPYYPQKITIQPPIDSSKGVAISSVAFQYPQWMEHLFISPQTTMFITEETKDFLCFYPNFRMNLSEDSIIKLSIARLTRSMKSMLIMDIILEIVIGVESLLVEGGGNLSLQFRLNTNWLIGDNYKERKEIKNFCKYLYKIRSEIVHGGGKIKEIEKIVKKIGGIQKTAELAKKLYRLILLKTVEIKDQKIEFIGRNKLIDKIKEARLGGDLQIEEHEVYKRNYDDFIRELKKK
ncbi:MAG: hypothetical protein ACTSQE_13420 [Candidatus Heimdallarchaeaceae archaeon]